MGVHTVLIPASRDLYGARPIPTIMCVSRLTCELKRPATTPLQDHAYCLTAPWVMGLKPASRAMFGVRRVRVTSFVSHPVFDREPHRKTPLPVSGVNRMGVHTVLIPASRDLYGARPIPTIMCVSRLTCELKRPATTPPQILAAFPRSRVEGCARRYFPGPTGADPHTIVSQHDSQPVVGATTEWRPGWK